jgi:hypothetical protein
LYIAAIWIFLLITFIMLSPNLLHGKGEDGQWEEMIEKTPELSRAAKRPRLE